MTTELHFVWTPVDVNEDSGRLRYDTVLTSKCDVVCGGKIVNYWSFMTCTPHQTSLSVQIKKIEMDRSCSTYGEKERCVGFCWGILRERGYLEDLCVDGKFFKTDLQAILQWGVGQVLSGSG